MGWFVIWSGANLTARVAQYASGADAANANPGATFIAGPYPGKADALNAAAGPPPQASTGNPGLQGAIQGAQAGFAGGAFSGQIPGFTNPLDAIAEIGHWLGAFFAALTDVHMWISLGWILLGLILVIFAVWTLGREEGIIPNAAPVPVPLPI